MKTNIAVALASLVLMFFAAEGALRVASVAPPFSLGYVGEYENRPSQNFMPDKDTGWRMQPNQEFVWTKEGKPNRYRSNAQGFRALEDFHPGTETRRKIVFAGDSYTFGAGVENDQTFSAVVQAHSPKRVSYNLGMPGFGIDQIWLSVRHQGLPMKPALVVVALVDADFERSQMPHRTAEGFGKPAFQRTRAGLLRRQPEHPSAAYLFMEEHSRVLSLYRRAMRKIGTKYPVGEYWLLNEAILDELREDCRRAGVPVLFLYTPISTFQPFPMIGKYMRRVGANFIDLTALKPRPARSIYLPVDGHFSVEGHRFVAGLIENWIHTHMPEPR